jgi:hypothetical protein
MRVAARDHHAESAVSVSRSPGCQFRTWLMAWFVSRPEASIRLIS